MLTLRGAWNVCVESLMLLLLQLMVIIEGACFYIM